MSCGHLEPVSPPAHCNLFCRTLLFNKDFKRHLEAADLLTQQLPELLDEVRASLDLVFRWVVLRICDGNMQVNSNACCA